MTARKPKAPEGAGPAGLRLWRFVTGKFGLDEHESALLVEAVRTVDLLDQLDALVRHDGPLVPIPGMEEGLRAHPAAVEARQQRIVLARLFASLRLPADDELGRPQHRGGARGVYDITQHRGRA